jgi:anthranilate phosphoribosyltransferase
MSAFVIAAAGARVCKHGNRLASSTSGSFDLLEALGITFDLGPQAVARCIEEVGLGFCFAPRYHPGMRHAGPTRRELGVPTIFNFLGPLANPARPRRQVVGVSDAAMAEKMIGVLETNGATHAMVVYGHDGLDELTTTTTSTVLQLEDGQVRTFVVDPSALGLATATREHLHGGDAARNAELARRVFSGEAGPHRDIVLLNAAAGVVVSGLAGDLVEGVERAASAIDSGQAAALLDLLVEVSAAAAAAYP